MITCDRCNKTVEGNSYTAVLGKTSKDLCESCNKDLTENVHSFMKKKDENPQKSGESGEQEDE